MDAMNNRLEKIEVLIVTMNQHDHSLLDQMGVNTDVLVGNQADFVASERFEYNGHTARWLSLMETGVGLNRNNVLMRATGDICVLADDDMVFYQDYADTVARVFHENPEADVVIFNLESPDENSFKVKKKRRIGGINYARYGAARVAFRRPRILKSGVFFNLCFGGGCRYSSGEDTLFLHDCLKAKLKVIAVPETIAKIESERESTWFIGYTKKYMFDKGVVFAALYGKFAFPMALRFIALQYRKMKEKGLQMSAYESLLTMKKGIHHFYSKEY